MHITSTTSLHFKVEAKIVSLRNYAILIPPPRRVKIIRFLHHVRSRVLNKHRASSSKCHDLEWTFETVFYSRVHGPRVSACAYPSGLSEGKLREFPRRADRDVRYTVGISPGVRRTCVTRIRPPSATIPDRTNKREGGKGGANGFGGGARATVSVKLSRTITHGRVPHLVAKRELLSLGRGIQRSRSARRSMRTGTRPRRTRESRGTARSATDWLTDWLAAAIIRPHTRTHTHACTGSRSVATPSDLKEPAARELLLRWRSNAPARVGMLPDAEVTRTMLDTTTDTFFFNGLRNTHLRLVANYMVSPIKRREWWFRRFVGAIYPDIFVLLFS